MVSLNANLFQIVPFSLLNLVTGGEGHDNDIIEYTVDEDLN
jgi:hypothetical protein